MTNSPPANLVVPEAFETERLLIRAPRVSDAAVVRAAVEESIDELRPWMEWAQSVPTLTETEARLQTVRMQFEARTDFPLHLFLRETGAFVGGSGLHPADWSVPSFETGYWVRTSLAGRGYITEAVRGIAEVAFSQLGVKRLAITTSTLNERSRRVAERAGFALEGILRNERRHPDGSLRDTAIYARLP